MEQQNRSLFQRLIAAAVGASMLASLAACAKPPAETAAPKEQVTAEKAITELRQQSEALGFDNALDELEEKNTATIGGDTYIRLQQHYEGIPVYGKTIVYTANEDGQMTSVTGNVQDLDPDIDLTPTITPEQAQESIRAYAAEVLGMEQAGALTLEELSWADACIYTQSGSPVLAYAVTIGTDRVILDAHNGDILDWNCIIMADEIQYTGPEGTRSVAGAEPIDGSYILKDSQRNIYVYDAQGQTYWYPGTTTTPGAMFPDIPVLVQSPDTEFGDGDDNTASSGQAYTFLTELGNVYDFFAEMGEPGVGTFVGICNDLMNDPNDPARGYFGENGGGYCGPLDGIIEEALPDTDKPLDEITSAVVIIGSVYTANLNDHYDLFGHEYQHTVFQKHVGQSNNDVESGAINEGIADIMGELYESSRRNADWEHGDRIIHNPSQAELPASVSDIRFNSDGDVPFRRKDGTRTATDFSHGCSTIISHSAYLMWNGIDGTESKKLSEQQLAELWYRAVLMMPSDCDFILCRQLVEVAAQSMEGLTDQQRACVREALNQVGIASSRDDDFDADYLLAEDATLTVYDQNNEPYSGYTLRISGSIDMKEIASNMTPDIGWVVNRTVTVEEAGAYALDLPQGRYTLTITDPHYDEAYTIYAAISDEYSESNIDLITAYEEPLVVVIPEIDYENLVSDAYSDTFTDDNGWDYCFHIPQFNLYGDLAQQVNQTIYDHCYRILERDAYNCIDEYGYSELGGMLYCWGHHGDLASVVIETNASMWADTQYRVYSISTATGTELSMDELLAIYSMDRESFYDLVHSRLKQYWDEIRAAGNHPMDSFFEDRVSRTLADENIKKAVPFINPDGGLSFVANIYSLAAGDCYWHLINADGALETVYTECAKDHSKDNAEPTGDTLQYFIENCDLLYFTEADIQDFDLEMCLYARNAVFAKSGRKFQSQELQAYFARYSWYVPSVEPEAFTDDMLNRKQLANVELVQNLELKLKEAQEIDTLLVSLDGEEGIYTRYLHSGGYEALLGEDFDKNALEVSSCLADLDNDGTRELLLSLGTGNYGPRGMETCTFLLDIESNQVTKVANAYFGGGTMGGDYLVIRYDKEQQTHVLALDSHIRAGVDEHITSLHIYSGPNFSANMDISRHYFNLAASWTHEYADQIRSETSLYHEDGSDFYSYQIDEQYVAKDAFDSAWARFEEPREGFQPKAGSFVKPIA